MAHNAPNHLPSSFTPRNDPENPDPSEFESGSESLDPYPYSPQAYPLYDPTQSYSPRYHPHNARPHFYPPSPSYPPQSQSYAAQFQPYPFQTYPPPPQPYPPQPQPYPPQSPSYPPPPQFSALHQSHSSPRFHPPPSQSYSPHSSPRQAPSPDSSPSQPDAPMSLDSPQPPSFCRFGSKCRNSACPFEHPLKQTKAPVSPPSLSLLFRYSVEILSAELSQSINASALQRALSQRLGQKVKRRTMLWALGIFEKCRVGTGVSSSEAFCREKQCSFTFWRANQKLPYQIGYDGNVEDPAQCRFGTRRSHHVLGADNNDDDDEDEDDDEQKQRAKQTSTTDPKQTGTMDPTKTSTTDPTKTSAPDLTPIKRANGVELPINKISSGMGFELLMKMGWSQGKGLGKKENGCTEPLQMVIKQDKVGLRAENEY